MDRAERAGGALIGRQDLRAELGRIAAAAAAGTGGLVLLAGEAGVGKTRLATDVLQESGLSVLAVTAGPAPAAPFGPLVGALRVFLRDVPDGLPLHGRLNRYLPVLLPELGAAPAAVDRATLSEVIRSAFVSVAGHTPAAVFLDDLHEADHATLELLPLLAAAAGELPLLLVGAYRTEELPRDHPLRRLRAELRRAGPRRELLVQPLGAADTAALAEQILGRPVSPALAAVLQQRTDGLPLFVEELLAALRSAGRLRERGGAWQLQDATALLPVPDTIRDLVLLRASRLSDAAREAVEVAAVAGVTFDLDLVASLAGGEDILGEAFAHGLLVESGAGGAAFRHALIRDACYGDVPWPRRRALHRQLAAQLERRGAAAVLLAEHWLAGRESERARQALLRAASAAHDVHAYRDAAGQARRALELWPEGDLEPERIATLDRLAHCAQLSGDLAAAATAWREVTAAYRGAGLVGQQAETQRRLAGVYELQGAWEQALAAREGAAGAFAAGGRLGEAAAERLAAAAHLRSAARLTAALPLLAVATAEARQAGRVDLQARALGLEGNVRTRLGDFPAGVAQVRRGLALALEHNLSGPAAEVYQRLADALEHTGDYAAARQTYGDAAGFCQAQGAAATEQVCLACMTAVLCQTGDWERCGQVCAGVLASAASPLHARAVANGMLGLVRAQRGEGYRARPALLEAHQLASRIELLPIELWSAWGLALVDELNGNGDEAARRCRGLLARWERTEECHYAVPTLRWAVSLFAGRGEEADARACASALARMVAVTGVAETVAALGHALGELSLLEAEPARAARHFTDALERLGPLELPFERAHTELRAGLALVAAGERAGGLRQLVDSYRGAQALGARPLAAAAARELARLGEPIDRRLGRRAAGWLQRGGLTRRELEVLRLVAEGHTDREIAGALVLSPRTVEMHVANCLGKLGCRTRAEAVRRGAELQLLAAVEAAPEDRTAAPKVP